MAKIYVNVLRISVALCFVISLGTAQVPSGQTVSDVPHRIPELLAVLMYDSYSPGFRDGHVAMLQDPALLSEPDAALVPEDMLDDSNIMNNDSNEELEDANNKAVAPAIDLGRGFMPAMFVKRGLYHRSRLDLFKRSSLNELIRRLMAMRGNSFTDGRASMMRFGAGRRK